MDGNVHILRPNYISFSNWKIAGIRPSSYFRKKALNKAIKRLPFKPDIIYAHFWHCGLEIYNYAKSNCIPLFVATGESIIPKSVINPNFRDFYEYVRGVICVSTKNKEESINNGMTTADKCLVAPNAINPAKFHILDKTKCRMDLNIARDAFVVAFCGAFIHRKGVKVLSDAIDSIDGKDVFSLFLGRPLEELPSCKNILFQGPVPHDYLIKYLNAADIFVLPTDVNKFKNFGYAFINFTSSYYIPYFYFMFNGKMWFGTNSQKICQLAYSKVQGKEALLNHYPSTIVFNNDEALEVTPEQRYIIPNIYKLYFNECFPKEKIEEYKYYFITKMPN